MVTTTASQPPKAALPIKPALNETAIRTAGLSYSYGERRALDDLSLDIAAGALFAVLGPNGGGKSTLFRLLSTLLPLQGGTASILGADLRRQAHAVRSMIGVVFQAPSLDRKLTVAENIRLQAALYGLHGSALEVRLNELLERFGLADRAGERTERLSGGLRRRAELAKGLIHRPQVLLLDEPSTGLDPAARRELWQYLQDLRTSEGTTIVLTTHYLEEAEDADRLAILSAGKLVALGTPAELRASVGGDSITIETADGEALALAIKQRFDVPARAVDGAVRLELADGHQWIAKLVEAYPGQINAIRVGKPTLEDVFIARTGHQFWSERGQP
jgi:ABC-2 type transport system ATP-binding protein